MDDLNCFFIFDGLVKQFESGLGSGRRLSFLKKTVAECQYFFCNFSNSNKKSPQGIVCTPGWSAGPNLPFAGVRFAGVFFPANGKFYAMGGRDAASLSDRSDRRCGRSVDVAVACRCCGGDGCHGCCSRPREKSTPAGSTLLRNLFRLRRGTRESFSRAPALRDQPLIVVDTSRGTQRCLATSHRDGLQDNQRK